MAAGDALDDVGAPVLVVEDDEDLRRLIHHVLDRQGYAVRAVAQGDALRAALRERPRPRLILVDADLEVRRHTWCTGIPVVCVEKPVSVVALRAAVGEALRAAA